MTPVKQELLIHARRLDKADVTKLIAQARVIAYLTDRQESEERAKEMRLMKEQSKKGRGSKK